MNYTINYPASIPVGQGQHVSCQSENQGTLVLTPPSQSAGNMKTSNNNPQPSFPMVMQVGNPSNPVFYTSQNMDGLVNTMPANENATTNNTGIAQVMLSPMQTGIQMHGNGNSPTLPAVNIRSENKPGVARSLGDIFNVQMMTAVPNPVPGNQDPQNSCELTRILSSLQAAGLQFIENPCRNGNSLSMNVPFVNNHQVQSSEINNDKSAMSSLISALKSSSAQVIENKPENTVSVSMANRKIEDNNVAVSAVSGSTVPLESLYKLVDSSGNVTVITTGMSDGGSNSLIENNVNENTGMAVPVGNKSDVGR